MDDFDNAGAGASATRPVQAGAVKKGSHVMLKGRPCKVVEYSTSKTGKHGHAKASITGIDIFTGKKYDENCPTSHSMEEPVVVRTQYTLLLWEDGNFHGMEANGDVRENLRWELGRDDKQLEEWKKQIEAGTNPTVTAITACGDEKILGPNDK